MFLLLDGEMNSEAQEEQIQQVDEARVANRARFELELEFVQSLANPYYLQSLAQQGILNQPAFVNFLKYLLYWKEKDYARFLLCVICNLLVCAFSLSIRLDTRMHSII